MNKQETKKLVIIGSGPAGLTAGMYAARANLQPVIFEGTVPGGQLISTTDVENWPGEKKIKGLALIEQLKDHALNFGCTFREQTITKIDTSTTPFVLTTDQNETCLAQSIILAPGAKPKRLNVPGEQTYWGKGVSACAVCDGALYRDQNVIVIGGGDTALENASFLTNFTTKVTVVHIQETLTASAPMRKRALSNPHINIIYNSTVTEIVGDGQHMKHAVITDQKTGKKTVLPAQGIFISIGVTPNTEFLQGTVELDGWGYIVLKACTTLGKTCTTIEGIFAAGDAVDYIYRQAITAAGTGCMAALDAERYLKKHHPGTNS
jgi:thioredoxin reductase (NADPH)